VSFATASDDRAVLRWLASFVLVLAAHGLVVLTLVRWQKSVSMPADRAQAVILDLPAAPPVIEPTPQPISEPEPPPLVQPSEPPPPIEPEELIEKIELPEVPQVVEPEVVLPPPPKPERKPPPPKPVVRQPEPPPKPAEAAPTPPPAAVAAPAASAPAARPAAQPSPDMLGSFHALLRAHLQRHMRYPRAAQMRNQHGVAQLRLILDRSGQVIEARVERSSGVAVLDREVLATVDRAHPLPTIPPELGMDRIDVLLPMDFRVR
jgi:periplasmic protein TonB